MHRRLPEPQTHRSPGPAAPVAQDERRRSAGSSLTGRFGHYRVPPSFTTRSDRDRFLNEMRTDRCVRLLRPSELMELWFQRSAVAGPGLFRCHVGMKFALHQVSRATYVRLDSSGITCMASLANDSFANGWTLDDAFVEEGRATSNIPPTGWWRNGPLLCNQVPENLWGDGYLPQLWEMIDAAVSAGPVPACEFLLNKRDAPLLPEDFAPSQPFAREVHRLMPGLSPACLPLGRPPATTSPASLGFPSLPSLPVLSQYVGDDDVDIPIPTVAEYELATGRYYLLPGHAPPFIGTGRPLLSRRPVAFFRGSATGYGVTAQTNPRLGLVLRSYEWSRLPGKRGKLDARLTGLNRRPKIQPDGSLRSLDPSTVLPRACVSHVRRNRVSYAAMQAYRYILYVDGNSGADRLAAYLASGSVILAVDPRAPRVQLFGYLRPWVHYVPVKWDLSDLEARIDWCRAHPDACLRIVVAAARCYGSFCTVDAIVERTRAAIRRAANQDTRVALPPPVVG